MLSHDPMMSLLVTNRKIGPHKNVLLISSANPTDVVNLILVATGEQVS